MGSHRNRPQSFCTALSGLLSGLATFLAIAPASAQPPTAGSQVTRTELIKQTLPAGNFREVQAVLVELPPGAGGTRHRHDVAVLAYVLEGTVENRFDGGAAQIHKAGDSWWEAPGTVHISRNVSAMERAKLLVVYIGEEGKAPTVPLPASRSP